MSVAPRVVVGELSRPHCDIRERAARLATGLRDLGIRTGDAVALIAKNDFLCLEASIATQRMDAFVVPINWHLRGSEIAHLIEDSGAKAVLAHDEYVPLIRSIVPERIPVIAARPSWSPVPPPNKTLADITDYDAWIRTKAPADFHGSGRGSSMIYTSGTTGKPKGVRRMAAGESEVEQRRALLALVYNARPGNTAIATGPLYHLFSLAVTTANLAAGASVVVMQRFDAEEFLRLVEKYRVTTAAIVPTMMVRLLRLPPAVRTRYDLSSLQYMIHTAAPCPPEIKRAMIAWLGPIIWENYGCSETGVITLVNSEEWLARPGTVGRAVLSGEIRIYDASGQRLPPNTVGEIYLKMHGSPDFTYHGDAAARAMIDRDGFATAGDIGYLDDDGYLYLCDRKTDMLITGGVNVYPQEIEAALLTHPQIVDAAVFGIPDDEFGESIAAHIQRIPGSPLTHEEVRAYLGDRLAKYKLPRVVVFDAALPREDNGKIYKQGLRGNYWAGYTRRI